MGGSVFEMTPLTLANILLYWKTRARQKMSPQKLWNKMLDVFGGSVLMCGGGCK